MCSHGVSIVHGGDTGHECPGDRACVCMSGRVGGGYRPNDTTGSHFRLRKKNTAIVKTQDGESAPWQINKNADWT